MNLACQDIDMTQWFNEISGSEPAKTDWFSELTQSQDGEQSADQNPGGDDDMRRQNVAAGQDVQVQNMPQANLPDQKQMPAEDKQQDSSIGSSIKSAVTGEGHKQYDLPEFDLPFEFSARQAKTALGLMSTFKPEREVQVLKHNYPNLKFSKDKFDNVIVDGSAYGGGVGYLNLPGISIRDLADMGFQVASFTPAGKAGAAAKSILGRAAAVGGASAATETGMDLANQASGGTDDVSLKNVDKGNVAIAGAGGAFFEGIGNIAARYLPKFRKTGEITDDIRNAFRTVAKEKGIDPDTITDDMMRSFMQSAEDSVKPEAMGGAQASSEFGIPYTKGQLSKNVKQLNLEDSMRHGAAGSKAQDVMQTFEESQQKPAIAAARARTQANLSGGKATIESATDAGETVREGLKSRATTLDQAISDAYDSVGKAYLSPKSMSDLGKKIIKASKSTDFIADPKLAPASTGLVNDFKTFTDFLDNAGGRAKAFPIKRIEDMRRRINAYASSAANPTDKRQVVILKKAFDDYLDSAVDNALFSGDQTALDALKKARGLRAEYARQFQRVDTATKSGRAVKDQAGDVIERIIAADPTDEQVVNYVFGASKLGGRQAGAKVASKLKDVLGPDSKEWASIREAGFLRLTEPRTGQDVSGRIFRNRLTEALRDSPTLMDTLYTKQEQALMQRLANAIVRAQPEIGNPSKTAYKSSQIIQQAWSALATTLGFNAGGPTGAIAASGAVNGGKFLASLRAARKAKDATNGVIKPFGRFNIGGAGAAGSVAVSNSDSHP